MSDHLDFIRIIGLEDSFSEVFSGLQSQLTTGTGTALTQPEAATASGDIIEVITAIVEISDAVFLAYMDFLFPVGSGLREMQPGESQPHKTRGPLAVISKIGWLEKFLSIVKQTPGPLKTLGEWAFKKPLNLLVLIEVVSRIIEIVDTLTRQSETATFLDLVKNGLFHLPPNKEDIMANYVSTLKSGLLELTKDPNTNQDTLIAYLSGIFDLALKDYVLKFGDNMELYTKAMALKY
jgi:hypothetical protein